MFTLLKNLYFLFQKISGKKKVYHDLKGAFLISFYYKVNQDTRRHVVELCPTVFLQSIDSYWSFRYLRNVHINYDPVGFSNENFW